MQRTTVNIELTGVRLDTYVMEFTISTDLEFFPAIEFFAPCAGELHGFKKRIIDKLGLRPSSVSRLAELATNAAGVWNPR